MPIRVTRCNEPGCTELRQQLHDIKPPWSDEARRRYLEAKWHCRDTHVRFKGTGRRR